MRPHTEREEDGLPEVHVPKAHHSGRPSIWMLLLEVALIGTGVFLGLMGEEWRESRAHHELAATALHNFRTEILANGRSIAGLRDYHVQLRKRIGAFVGSPGPKTLAAFAQQGSFDGMRPVRFERTAYDLAIATQALAYLDQELAFAISRVYTRQQLFQQFENDMSGALFAPGAVTENFAGLMTSAVLYLNEVVATEPALAKSYDELVAQIDTALGTPATAAATSH